MPAAVSWTLSTGVAVSVVACACALAARVRRARVVGAVVCRGRRARRGRVAFTLVVVAVGVCAPGQGAALAAPALALLAGALLSAWLAPGADEGVCGEDGVAVGWEAASFGELTEWRLIGDHLRFRTGGEWRAVDLPSAEHGAMRARLEACCPERESAFSRGAPS